LSALGLLFHLTTSSGLETLGVILYYWTIQDDYSEFWMLIQFLSQLIMYFSISCFNMGSIRWFLLIEDLNCSVNWRGSWEMFLPHVLGSPYGSSENVTKLFKTV